MNEKRRIIALIIILAVSITIIASVTIFLLYRTAFEQQTARLAETAQSRARMMEAVARFDIQYSDQDIAGGAFAATLLQVFDAHSRFEGFGETGEFTLAKRDGDDIVFLLSHRHTHDESETPDSEYPLPTPIPFNSDIAEPMRRALSGKSGTLVGLDYRAAEVLAAYEPVDVLNLGIVAKIDLAEIRAPFIRAGIMASGVGIIMILVGIFLFLRISDPMIRRLEESEQRLTLALEGAQDGVWDVNIMSGDAVYSDRWASMLGYDLSEVEPKNDSWENLLHPDDHSRVMERINDHLEGKTSSYSAEFRMKAKSGEWRWILSRGRIVERDSRGKPQRMTGTHYDITERKQAEETLRETQDYLLKAQEIAKFGNWSWEKDKDIGFFSEEVYNMLGYTIGEIQPSLKWLLGIMHPDDREQVIKGIEESMRTGKSYAGAYRLTRKDGKEIIVDSRAEVVLNHAGEATEMIGVIQDITERKQAEEALRASETKYQDLYDNAPDMYVSVDPETAEIIGCNETFSKRIGYKTEEIIGRPIFDMYHPDCMEEAREAFNSYVTTGVVSDKELQLKKKDGTKIEVSLNVSAVRDEQGKILYSRSSWRDITKRKQMEEALRESESRYRELIEESGLAFLIDDLDGNFIYFNDTFAGLFGYGREEMQKLRIQDLVHPDDFDEGQMRHRNSIRAPQQSSQYELRAIKKDGSIIHLEINSSPIKKGNKISGFRSYIRDITEKKLAEEALIDSEEKYRQLFTTEMDAIMIFDGETRQFVDVNDAAIRLYGYSREEFLKLEIIDITAEPEASERAIQKIVAGTPATGMTRLHKKKDGTIFPVEISGSSFKLKGRGVGCGIVRDITERKQAEEELKRSEKSLSRAQHIARLGNWDWNILTRQLFWSDEIYRIFGRSADEFDPTFGSFLSLVHLDDLDRVQEAVDEAMAKNRPYSIDHRIVRPDGEIRIVHEQADVTFNNSGQPVRMVGTVQDITERNKAEEALRESEGKFESFSENLPGVVCIYDLYPDGHRQLLYLGTGLERLLGKAAADKIGNNVDEYFRLIHPEDLPELQKAADEARETGQVLDHEYRIGIDSVNYIWVRAVNQATCRENGIVRWSGQVYNMTMQKAAEDALRESEEKYKGLVENIGIGISLISPQMEILSLNRKMQEWFPGVDPSKRPVCYESYGDPPKTKEICSYCPVAKTLRDGNVHEAVSETPAGDETKNYRIISSPINDVSGNIVAVIEMVEDVTEKLKVEKERERADKLESIGILAGGIAHDFNNILAGFMGSVSRAKMDINPNSEAFKALERAEAASIRAVKLTDQLLTFSKGGAPIKEKASIEELVRDTVGFALSGSNVKYDILIPDDIWEVKVDKGQISQVIQNLVMNAAQAMPSGGETRILVENLQLEPGQLVSLDKGKYVKISVQDHGIGIPDDYLQKIFDPYFTTKQQGSGLGLATVYSVVKNHDGHIDVTSELGVGTTFDVYLPATGKARSKERPSETAIVPGSGKVLVVDDEEIIRITLADILTKIGYEVKSASEGQEAIRLFKKEKDRSQPFDIVILDLTIPGGMGGKEAISKLREIDPDVKAVVSSGYSTDPVIASFREHGFSGYIKKPFKVSDLSTVLDDILRL